MRGALMLEKDLFSAAGPADTICSPLSGAFPRNTAVGMGGLDTRCGGCCASCCDRGSRAGDDLGGSADRSGAGRVVDGSRWIDSCVMVARVFECASRPHWGRMGRRDDEGDCCCGSHYSFDRSLFGGVIIEGGK